jgi:hypothetical protein
MSHPVVWTQPARWPSNMDHRLVVFDQSVGLIIADWSQLPKKSDPATWLQLDGAYTRLGPDGNIVDRSDVLRNVRRMKK